MIPPDVLNAPNPPSPPSQLPLEPPDVSGRAYNVSETGADSGTGGPDRPFRTINKALAVAKGGEFVLVESGSYPAIRDQIRRREKVTLLGWGASRPKIAGMAIYGGTRLVFEDLSFTKGVTLTGDPIMHAQRPAEDVEIRRSEITIPGDTCVVIRSGSTRVLLEDNWIHNCYTGIGGPGGTAPSSNITIRGNLLEHFVSDGIQFAHWSDVTLARNVIRDARDPNHVIHNDGIQFTGDSHGVVIANNRISDSAGQLLFIQDAFGSIDDVLVQNNLIYRADAYAVQSQGATNVRFVNNTIWKSGFGGLLLRQGHGAPTVPTDTILVNNILSGFGTTGGASAAVREGNVLGSCAGSTDPPGFRCLRDPGFVDAASDDYRLASSSPARGHASAAWAPDADMTGATRSHPPSPGALE